MKPLDLAGQRFDHLTAVRVVSAGTQGKMWLCACDCGGDSLVAARRLKFGLAHSCGCKQNPAKHGHCRRIFRTPEYIAWRSMKSRCYRKKDLRFADYGGRGIRVCQRWLASFDNFLADMGLRPKGTAHRGRSEFSLDRINSNGNYEPTNCRWATQRQQVHNRRAA